MQPSDPNDKRPRRTRLGLIDRNLIIEELKAVLNADTIARNVFRALMLTVIVVATTIEISPTRVGTLIGTVLLVGVLWGQETSSQQAELRELRQLLISRRSRESEDELYDDYIRFRHYRHYRLRVAEPALWTLWSLLVLLLRYWMSLH